MRLTYYVLLQRPVLSEFQGRWTIVSQLAARFFCFGFTGRASKVAQNTSLTLPYNWRREEPKIIWFQYFLENPILYSIVSRISTSITTGVFLTNIATRK